MLFVLFQNLLLEGGRCTRGSNGMLCFIKKDIYSLERLY